MVLQMRCCWRCLPQRVLISFWRWRRKAVAARLFTVPHYLFGDWGGEARVRLAGSAPFCWRAGLYEFTVVFCNSMARENWPFLQGAAPPVLEWLRRTLCLWCQDFVGHPLHLARAFVLAGRCISWRGGCISTGRTSGGSACDGAAGGQGCAAAAQLQAILPAAVPTLAACGSAALCGYHRTRMTLSERSGSYRLMFGYGHPNTFGGIVFGLVLAWVLLRAARLTWAEIAAVAGVGLFLLEGPGIALPCAVRIFAGRAAGWRASWPGHARGTRQQPVCARPWCRWWRLSALFCRCSSLRWALDQ